MNECSIRKVSGIQSEKSYMILSIIYIIHTFVNKLIYYYYILPGPDKVLIFYFNPVQGCRVICV